MSSIIKAEQATKINPFSFRNIASAREQEEQVEEVDGKDQEVAGADPEPAEPEEPEGDPLEELEMMIQNRLNEAERRAQELESEAYEKGYSQGMHDGTEMGLKTMTVIKENLDKLFMGLQELPRRVLADYRGWLLSTSIAIARHITGREMDTHPEIIAYLVQSLLEEAAESHSLAVYLNPKDLEQLEEHADLKDLLARSERSFVLKQDDGISRGGCRLESDLQLLDATLEKRFALIEEALRRRDMEEAASSQQEEEEGGGGEAEFPSNIEEEEAEAEPLPAGEDITTKEEVLEEDDDAAGE